MPLQPQTPHLPPGCRKRASIRDHLEASAWQQYPQLATRLSGRQRAPSPPRRALRWQDRTLLILGIVLMALLLLRIETARADEEWGLQLLSADQQWSGMGLETRIVVEVTGLIARVEVTQAFNNPGSEFAEGIYRFPLPDGAAVDRLRRPI